MVVRIGILVKQLPDHQHESGRAIATLEGAGLDERLLHGAELVRRVEALDREHVGAVYESRQIQAPRHRAAVDDHRAAAAHALAAGFARAGERELRLQHLDQVLVRLDVGRDRRAVEGEADGACGGHLIHPRGACRPWHAAPGTRPRR